MPESDTNRCGFTRVFDGTPFAYQGGMRHQEEQIGGYDIGVAVLLITTAWLLIFQSGLFSR
jgi:hypothetical protein